MGPPAPPPVRGAEQQPRLIQRMESGYESSERNSSSPDRLGAASAVSVSRLFGGRGTTPCCPFTGRWGNRSGR